MRFVTCESMALTLEDDIKDRKKHGSDAYEGESCIGRKRGKDREERCSRLECIFWGRIVYWTPRSNLFFIPSCLSSRYAPRLSQEEHMLVSTDRAQYVLLVIERGRVTTTRTRQCCIAAMISLISRSAVVPGKYATIKVGLEIVVRVLQVLLIYEKRPL